MIHIVLVEPEIPQNTGNISRTCACTGVHLHLVGKLGFEITDAKLKRAGLDYWDKLILSYHDSLEALKQKYKDGTFFFLTTKAKKNYAEVTYGDNCFLVFGKESKGLPEQLIYDNYDNAVRIPMGKDVRSLNLSNSAAIVLYEALRQTNFPNLT